MAETRKAATRRWLEGWFDDHIVDPGIDIGSGVDPLNDTFRKWDNRWTGDGDAQQMEGVPDGSYMTVYASHILEHLEDPIEGLRNWWRILAPGGKLIVCVPHRDLYEKKKTHPSRWNPRDREGGGGHLTFWMPELDEAPDTLSFRRVLSETIPDAEWVDFKVLDEGYDYSLPEDVHPVGEYAIEAILRKPHGA